MIGVEIDFSDVEKEFRRISRSGPRVISKAVNSTLTDAKKQTVRAINAAVFLKKSYIAEERNLRIGKASTAKPEGVLVARSRGTLLSRYPYRLNRGVRGPGRTRPGARAVMKIVRGKTPSVLNKAFEIKLRKSNVVGLAVRTGSGPNDYKVLHGLSVKQLAKASVFEKITPQVRRVLAAKLAAEYDRILAQELGS